MLVQARRHGLTMPQHARRANPKNTAGSPARHYLALVQMRPVARAAICARRKELTQRTNSHEQDFVSQPP